ncbi:MAG: hypothetical protein M3144_08635 [Actinomycetota bacterium]|nr:hypothetical protein [Actinomycetota bacterium]
MAPTSVAKGQRLVAVALLGLLAWGACGTDESSSPPPEVPTTLAEVSTTTSSVTPATAARRPVRPNRVPPVTPPSQPPPAQCTTVGFTPATEDAASSIVATGLRCAEAESFLRELGPLVSPNGPSRVQLDGFDCVLYRHEDEPLPQGFYECTSGSKRITFVRS